MCTFLKILNQSVGLFDKVYVEKININASFSNIKLLMKNDVYSDNPVKAHNIFSYKLDCHIQYIYYRTDIENV